MGDRIASWFGIVLVGVVLVASYWYARTLRAGLAAPAARVGAVDVVAEGVALTGFDDQGRARYRLFADRMTHFGSSDDVDMVRPRILSMRPDQPQVEASARTARALNNAQTLILRDDVVLQRAADRRYAAMRIETEELWAEPDTDHFWTNARVHMRSGDAVLDAHGLDYDNIAQRVELQAEVSARFPPRRKP